MRGPIENIEEHDRWVHWTRRELSLTIGWCISLLGWKLSVQDRFSIMDPARNHIIPRCRKIWAIHRQAAGNFPLFEKAIPSQHDIQPSAVCPNSHPIHHKCCILHDSVDISGAYQNIQRVSWKAQRGSAELAGLHWKIGSRVFWLPPHCKLVYLREYPYLTWPTFNSRLYFFREFLPFAQNEHTSNLLSATVGFLTVSDLGSVSKAIAIVSTFTSLGSIIVGVFSIWRHQTNTERSAAVRCTYLFRI